MPPEYDPADGNGEEDWEAVPDDKNCLAHQQGDMDFQRPVFEVLNSLDLMGKDPVVYQWLEQWEHTGELVQLLDAVRGVGGRARIEASKKHRKLGQSDYYSHADWFIVQLALDLLAMIGQLPGLVDIFAQSAAKSVSWQYREYRDDFRKAAKKLHGVPAEWSVLRAAVPPVDVVF